MKTGKPRLTRGVFASAALIMNAATCHAAVVYVNAVASGANTGTSWADAYPSLQAALAAAGFGTDVWVARGTYAPSLADPNASFVLPGGVRLFGGFSGTESDPSQRVTDPDRSVADPATDTVLTGEIGAPGSADNIINVVKALGAGPATVIDGCTITAGAAGASAYGGGILLDFSQAVVRNCSLLGNSAAVGGAITVTGGSPIIDHCFFKSNTASIRGGGVFVWNGGFATVTSCTFDTNSGVSGGGALSFSATGGAVSDCFFKANSTGSFGGAIEMLLANVAISRCTFTANGTDINNGGSAGGGIWSYQSGGSVTSCRFTGNTSRQGGAVYVTNGATTSFVNCLIASNTGFAAGAGYVISANPAFVNCTIVGNTDTANFIGGFNVFNSTPKFTNCIIRNNAPSQIVGTGPIVTYTNIQGGYAGVGNINQPAQFTDAASGDYSLLTTSPGIDAGSNAEVPAGVTTDLGGSARFRDIQSVPDSGAGAAPIVDMGAFETQPPPCPGDLNADGQVNTADLTQLLARFGQSVTPGSTGDINGDATVNTADLTLLLARFGQPCP